MSYFDREMLLNTLMTKDSDQRRKLMAQVDRKRIEQGILHDGISEFLPFECTYEPVEDESYERMSLLDQDLMEQILEWVQGSQVEARRGLKYLQKMKKKYPKVPMIYNFIGGAYHTLGKDLKHHHAIKETCKKFPNYVFGKISWAEYQLKARHHQAIPEIFNHKLHLYMHYPDVGENPVFHAVEVQSFYTVIGRYYARNKQLAHAIKCYFIVEKADPESSSLKVLSQEIFIAETAALIAKGFGALKNGV